MSEILFHWQIDCKCFYRTGYKTKPIDTNTMLWAPVISNYFLFVDSFLFCFLILLRPHMFLDLTPSSSICAFYILFFIGFTNPNFSIRQNTRQLFENSGSRVHNLNPLLTTLHNKQSTITTPKVIKKNNTNKKIHHTKLS